MSLDSRVDRKNGLIIVSDSTFDDLAKVSSLVRDQLVGPYRLNPSSVCVTELKPPMFSNGLDKEKEPAKSVASSNPAGADRLWGIFYANKQNQRLAWQWFSVFTGNYYAGLANPKPLLVLMGPTGSGKTFCLSWMITAFDVLIHSIDPLDYKQSGGLKPGKKQRKKSETKTAIGSDDSDNEEHGDVSVEDEEKRTMRRLSVAAGQDGESLRQLLMPNPLSKPKLIHIQGIQLCRPDFIRYLIALIKIIAKIPRANGVVLELNPDEAFAKQQSFDDKASLGVFLQKQPYCQFLKFFPAKPPESRKFLVDYRKKLDLKPLPIQKKDNDLLSRITLEARGDLRQLGILTEWTYLPTYGKRPEKLGALTPFYSETDRSVVTSDIDVGLRLLDRAKPFGYREACDVAQQLRSGPMFQVSEFYRSWILSFEDRSDPTKHDDSAEIKSCTTDALVQVMIRSLQMLGAAAARKSGTFANYKHIRQLPPIFCADIFGQASRQAAQTTCLRELILAQSYSSPDKEETEELSIKRKRTAVAHVSTDRQGYVDFDKIIPRRKTTKKKDNSTTVAHVSTDRKIVKAKPMEIRIERKKTTPVVEETKEKRSDDKKLLLCLTALSDVACDFDVNPYIPEAEAHYIYRAHSIVQEVNSSPAPDWPTISKWLHPKRFDFAFSSTKNNLLHPDII